MRNTVFTKAPKKNAGSLAASSEDFVGAIDFFDYRYLTSRKIILLIKLPPYLAASQVSWARALDPLVAENLFKLIRFCTR